MIVDPTTITSLIGGNQFLSGGILLGILGSVAYALKSLPRKLYNLFKRFFVYNIEINSGSAEWEWMNLWLAEHYSGRRVLDISSTTKDLVTAVTKHNLKVTSGTITPEINLYYCPGSGFHWFFYKGRLVTFNKTKIHNQSGGHTYSLNFNIFARSKSFIDGWLKDIYIAGNTNSADVIKFYRSDGDYFGFRNSLRKRKIDSVIMPSNVTKIILNDIKKFHQSEASYHNLGIPYHRGYLLHGSPGNGKSSLIHAIASELGLDIYVINLTSVNMSDSDLDDCFKAVPANGILVIEDIDCVFEERKVKIDNKQLTFQGLLNSIDGLNSSTGLLLFVTTNHLNKLDSALLRQGRLDMHIEINNPDEDQKRRMVKKFFPGQTSGATSDILNGVNALGDVSMARIQEFLISKSEII